METVTLLRIERMALVVPDLDAACAFYTGALGFAEAGRERRDDAGVDGAHADVAVLTLGAERIELLAFAPPGRSYPVERSAADPWFQHFAIVVADMDAAYATLRKHDGWQTISIDGPQLLPPATGSIRAFKFRDPAGHPLELSWFPREVAAPHWRDPAPGRVFLGIDHTALAVRDMAASIAFFAGVLGMRHTATLLNTGPTQERLDGLTGVEVDIAILEAGDGPHLELLCYRGTKRAPSPPPAVDDIAATRLVLAVEAIERLRDVAGLRWEPDGLVTLRDGSTAALVRDPDGHLIELHQR